MRQHHVSSLIVVDAAGHAAGLLTQEELHKHRHLQGNLDHIARIMKPIPATLAEHDSIAKARELLARADRVAVIEDGRPVGMVVRADLQRHADRDWRNIPAAWAA